MGEPDQPHPLDIPACLKRDANNKAEFMKMAESTVSNVAETKPAKAKAAPKANGAAKPAVKAAGKPAAKTAGKPPAKAKTAPKAAVKAAKAPAKVKASKPKAEVDAFGFRKGSAKSKAVQLYSRKNGATLEEVKEAVGSVQLNVLNALEAGGHTVERKKEEREGARPVTRYILKAK